MTAWTTNIAWTDSTWNPATGCTPVSAGCDNCYAAAMFSRTGLGFGHAFNDVTLHPDRLEHVKRFKPRMGPDGRWLPHKVFVNSISDLFHDAIPDAFIRQVFEAMRQNPATVFQALTKRPIRMRRFLLDCYLGGGVPENIWIGVSVEDNRVAKRLDILRDARCRTGGTFTAFASVEPLIGPADQMDFTGVAWVIVGGESGARARVMQPEWLLGAIENAKRQPNRALFLKQHGQIRSNPLLRHAPAQLGLTAKFRWLIDHQLEVLGDEKGGATLENRVTYREFPLAYHLMADALNRRLI